MGGKKWIDLIGQRFGRLVVKEIMYNESQKRNYAYCLCDCGKEKLVNISGLRGGRITSCGCFHKEQTSKACTTHGMYKSRLHKESGEVWNIGAKTLVLHIGKDMVVEV